TTGEDFSLPPWVRQLVSSGRLGEKTGAGFYRKVGKDIQTLDWKTGEYAPQSKPDLSELAALQALPLPDRLRALGSAEGHHAAFVRKLLLLNAHYALTKAPELADDIVSIDRAMEWGYGWEIGPFAQMDAMGLDLIRTELDRNHLPRPPLL